MRHGARHLLMGKLIRVNKLKKIPGFAVQSSALETCLLIFTNYMACSKPLALSDPADYGQHHYPPRLREVRKQRAHKLALWGKYHSRLRPQSTLRFHRYIWVSEEEAGSLPWADTTKEMQQ